MTAGQMMMKNSEYHEMTENRPTLPEDLNKPDGLFGSMLADRLEEKVYGSDKGRIRLTLIREDLEEFWPPFASPDLTVLDAGGGSGHFARICARQGHRVLLCDTSRRMLEMAEEANRQEELAGRITLMHGEMTDPDLTARGPFDLVLLHGAAEWTADPEETIRSVSALVRPGGCLSLLVFNRDKHMLKKGINGMLIRNPVKRKRMDRQLTPPEGLSSKAVRSLLAALPGKIRLQSGIRVFHQFFLSQPASLLTGEEWLQQERLCYRTSPFNALGEHTHIIWVRDPDGSSGYS